MVEIQSWNGGEECGENEAREADESIMFCVTLNLFARTEVEGAAAYRTVLFVCSTMHKMRQAELLAVFLWCKEKVARIV